MIELKNIEITYADKTIINNFNMNIKKGEKILLKGLSGSGKTTILKIILGFVKPNSGEVFYNQKIIDEKNIWEIRRNMCYISQDVDFPKIEVLKVFEEIFDYKNNKNKILDLSNLYFELEKYKLDKSILKKNVKILSGGERGRIGIIISKLLKKEIYLLDEINAALDLELKKIVVDNFINSKKTVIVVTHDKIWEKTGKFRVINLERS
ncbi:MAG: hypothetical protein B6I28_04815 [Fusobacteriia bacterium 4572_132]|nr:MAG: hypothetical protein B6I28_04815 [Fusobacteriia bacterium 4572_132]